MLKEQAKNGPQKRPPVVVVLGHVDHGKSTLIDYIRKSDTAAKEAGGITQAIGSYEIEHKDTSGLLQKITFIDTPGHEAFGAMRAHGARVADVAVLVVAADDGVKPQTKESIKCIKEAKIPFVVAVNKADLPAADIEKTKNELLQTEVFLEGMGGNVSWQVISAKTGEGVSDLLDLILLTAEMEELSFDAGGETKGVILTGRRDPRRGVIVGLVVKNGALEKGQYIAVSNAKGKVKILEDGSGRTVKTIFPSAPALVFGFETIPSIGEEFVSGKDKKKISAFMACPDILKIPVKQKEDEAEKMIFVVLKADETGSLEALKNIAEKIAAEKPLSIAEATVGDIIENTVKNAPVKNGIIIGFRSKVEPVAKKIAEIRGIPIITSDVIYDLEERMLLCFEKDMKKKPPTLKILAVFGKSKGKEQVVGGQVKSGIIKNRSVFLILRDNKEIGKGKIKNLQSGKDNISEVHEGKEAGLLIDADFPIEKGDELVFENKEGA